MAVDNPFNIGVDSRVQGVLFSLNTLHFLTLVKLGLGLLSRWFLRVPNRGSLEIKELVLVRFIAVVL